MNDIYDTIRAYTDEVGAEKPAIFKKKFRWTVEGRFAKANFGPNFVKMIQTGNAFRPDPTKKGGFICTRYYGIDTKGEKDWYPKKLFELIADFYRFGGELFSDPAAELEHIEGKLGEIDLTLYDGCGGRLETWKLSGCWPHSVNFGELCYSSSDEIDIEVTWGYKEIEYVSAQKQ